MKSIAILGGGIYQVPMISRAVERGLHVIAASLSKDDPGMHIAHESWQVDLTDHDAILELAKRHSIDAVATTGTEFSIPTIGYLHDTLGLPGITLETALATTSKIAAQKRFSEHGVPSAQFRKVRTLDEAREAANTIGYPVYVKSPDSSGSRGISMAASERKLPDAVQDAFSHAKTDEILIEEQLTGLEFGAQVIVVDGSVWDCICHNDTVTPPPITVPVGHSVPFRESDDVAKDAWKVCEAAVKALGIDNAVCNADLIATPDGVRIFEIGARIGATGIAEIIKLHYDIDLYDINISMALGETPSYTPSHGPGAAYGVIMASETGTLEAIAPPSLVTGNTDVVDIHFDYPVGTEIRKFRTGPDRIGHVLVTGESADDAESLASDILNRMELTIRR